MCPHRFGMVLSEPAAAPTPVEPEPTWLSVPNEQAWWWHFNGDNYTVPHIFSVMVSNTGTPRYFVQYPDSRWCDEIGGWWLKVEYPNVPTREYMRSSAPAESQGVERAQPVEGPREPTCKLCGEVEASHPVLEEERECLQFKPWSAAQPAKHTDRPAETISSEKWRIAEGRDFQWFVLCADNSVVAIVNKKEDAERIEQAETRIEVLEAALRRAEEALLREDTSIEGPCSCATCHVVRAALAAPSGEQL